MPSSSPHHQWGPTLRTIMMGIHDSQSPLHCLLGFESQLVRYLYSFLMDYGAHTPLSNLPTMAASPAAHIHVIDQEQFVLEGNFMACYSPDRGTSSSSFISLHPPESIARVSFVGCAISPHNFQDFYVAVIDYGGPVLCLSQDRGSSWTNLPLPRCGGGGTDGDDDGEGGDAIVLECFQVDSRCHAHKGRLWLGTQSSGAYFSDDQGQTWTNTLQQSQGVIHAFDLTSNQYAGDDEIWVLTCFPSSMYHSLDGGKSWSTHPVPSRSVGDFALDSHYPTRQYMSCQNLHSGEATVYRRDNDHPRTSWNEIVSRTPQQGGGRMPILVHPHIPDRLYVGLHRAVLRSEDGGDTWTTHDMVKEEDHSPVVMALSYQSGRIFAKTAYGIYQSLDEGLSWQRAAIDKP